MNGSTTKMEKPIYKKTPLRSKCDLKNYFNARTAAGG
jgi:hypothetical protein